MAGFSALIRLVASLHAWRGGSLPEKREELYADTVDLLLDWWESPKVARDAQGNVVVQQPSLVEWLRVEDRDKVRSLLNELAYEAHAAQADLVGTADVPEGELLSGLMRLTQNPEVRNNPSLLVRYLSQRAGLLLPRGVGVYTFPHRTFQEYLAACHLTDHDYPDAVAKLAREDPNRWREVALLAGQALVDSADLERVSERNQGKVACVRSHLVRVLEAGRLPAVERAAAGRSLTVLRDPRPGVGLRPDGLPDIAWCEVPAGPFLMGDEQEPNETITQPYRISRYPVTNAQFAAFLVAGGYAEQRYWQEAQKAGVWQGGEVKDRLDDQPREAPYDYGEPFSLPNHPVVGVTWHEALAFCRWLTEQLREAGDLDTGAEIALPNEPQWEKAVRGTDGRVYPWGDEADPDRANYDGTGIGTTSAVGGFPGGTSPYGVEDLSGNVWEWTASEDEWGHPVLRGGSFFDVGSYVRCAFRYWDPPHGRYGDLGFRVVASPVRSDL